MHLIGGETSSSFTTPTIALGYSTTGRYPQYIHTRHNSNNATSNAIDFYTSAGTSDNFSSAVHGMTIMNGSVGIGTTNPGDLMHIYNSGANTNLGYISQNGTRQWRAEVRGDTSSIYAIQDDTAAKMRLAIDSNGNVGIGTAIPGATLDVVGTAKISGVLDIGIETMTNTCTPATTCTATCSTGKRILGGGCGLGSSTYPLYQSYPSGTASFICTATGSTYIIAYAICGRVQ